MASLGLLFSFNASASVRTQIIPLETCLELGPMPGESAVNIEAQEDGGVIASVTYVYQERDTGLLLVLNDAGTQIDKSRIVQKKLQRQTFVETAIPENGGPETRKDAKDVGLQKALAEVRRFLESNAQVRCRD